MAANTQASFGQNPPQSMAANRGRLKIFLGYASGVGKTFRMLDEARRRKERGEDVIVAGHQPGAHAEIRTLLDNMEIIPLLRTSLGEGLHMDAILKRHPQVCVIDPLAHNNPDGFPNRKRWQDIEVLLQKGISVLTSINILHIEDLRERVEKLTGKHTKETVPREFLARADEIVIVDVPTDLAMERRGDESAQPAAGRQREQSLSELREMALVLAADVVEKQLERYLEGHALKPAWGAQERLLVCLTPDSDATSMIACGKRNHERFHGEFHVVHVHQPRISAANRARLRNYLELARQAGAEVHVLEGDDPTAAILEFARQKKITQIFVGHSKRRDWLSRIWRGPLNRLLNAAEQMDVRIFPQ